MAGQEIDKEIYLTWVADVELIKDENFVKIDITMIYRHLDNYHECPAHGLIYL